MKKQILGLVSIAIFFFSCGNMELSKNKESDSKEEKIEENKEEARTEIEIKEFYAWVDKLRVRAVPGLESKAEFVDVLDEGEKVAFLGEKSSENFEVALRGRTMKAPFYKVKTQKGKIGWIFAGALSSFPIEVEYYRVAIFFDNTNNESDWSYYASTAMNELSGTGIESLYVNDNFDAIQIRNHRNDIIGTENISKLVREKQIGVVCVEKGKGQKYVDYSTNMEYDILDVYGMSGHCIN